MKTKLLRKVRKEFKIEYWPNGEVDDNTPFVKVKGYQGGRVILISRLSFQYFDSARTKEEAILKARELIVNTLRRRYPRLGSYRKKFTKQQIWP